MLIPTKIPKDCKLFNNCKLFSLISYFNMFSLTTTNLISIDKKKVTKMFQFTFY